MRSSVYLETTVISYLAARPSRDLIVAAHQQITEEWWELNRTDYDVFVSQLVIQESQAGDEKVKERRLNLLQEIPILEIKDDAVELARSLINNGVVPEKAVGDALHIAVATVNGMDYLLTWNLSHLANARIRNDIAAVCLKEGYEPPIICTPEELMEGSI